MIVEYGPGAGTITQAQTDATHAVLLAIELNERLITFLLSSAAQEIAACDDPNGTRAPLPPTRLARSIAGGLFAMEPKLALGTLSLSNP